MDLDLVEAWRLWAASALPKDAELWGVSILWWGRVGIVAQTLASLPLFVELIGYERLRRVGERLQRETDPTKLVARVRDSFVWPIGLAARRSHRLLFRLAVLLAIPCILLLAYFTMVPEIKILGEKNPDWRIDVLEDRGASRRLWGAFWVSVFGGVTLGATLAVATSVSLRFATSVIEYTSLRPVSYMLAHPKIRVAVITVALFLMVAGGHFLLLAA